jgi:hypothetical protein
MIVAAAPVSLLMITEPITPADGGLADLPTVCCVLVVMGCRAAAEFQRSAPTMDLDTTTPNASSKASQVRTVR